ncbi:DnaJ domain-containing protein [Reyranella soli]|uniref:Molecular chaperone DnaJ n=1 Tax=Reyranella soli TaxID=1230389 RepID=A0A512N495_9HYPH|nr:DnaJ domain-containing protein [Reyranella soli]GEP53773.1 molecular chaperone DnaJ [Reyranella soli]
MPFVLALVLLAAGALGIAWLLRANPSSVARGMRIALVVLGAIAVGGMLIFGLRFLPSLLPELFGLAGLVITGLIARALRSRPSGGFSSPGTGRRTEVRTSILQAWIDHSTGDVGGTVLAGRFAGRTLDQLSDSELLDLHEECRTDADSLRVMEAYLDRRLGVDWRTTRQPPPRGPRTDMTREEALAVLGLAESASEEEIRAAHRRLIRRTHPDAGGTADLAARINRAKDVLLGG